MTKKKIKVMFENLPKETWKEWFSRRIKGQPRIATYVRCSLNWMFVVIPRGVPVEVPDWVPEIMYHFGDNLPKDVCDKMKYDCYVLYEPRKDKNEMP